MNRASSFQANITSFLFVVNELEISGDYHGVERDMWDHELPPTKPRSYVNEAPSHVFRYKDGVVVRAGDYVWARPEGWGRQGGIYRMSKDGSLSRYKHPSFYKESTIASCNAHLPFVIVETDASVKETRYMFGNQGGDQDGDQEGDHEMDQEMDHIWSFLQFESKSSFPGVSFAVAGHSAGWNYVFGRNPSWIPALVPSTFQRVVTSSDTDDVPQSAGLSGDLSILLGLMAFSKARSRRDNQPKTNRIFLGGNGKEPLWHNRRWRSHACPKGYAHARTVPRIFLVHICCDDVEDPNNSTKENLQSMETCSVLVNETSA